MNSEKDLEKEHHRELLHRHTYPSHSEPFDDRLGLWVVRDSNFADVAFTQRCPVLSLDLPTNADEQAHAANMSEADL